MAPPAELLPEGEKAVYGHGHRKAGRDLGQQDGLGRQGRPPGRGQQGTEGGKLRIRRVDGQAESR